MNRDLDNVEAKKAVVDQQESDDEDVVEAKKAMSNYTANIYSWVTALLRLNSCTLHLLVVNYY